MFNRFKTFKIGSKVMILMQKFKNRRKNITKMRSFFYKKKREAEIITFLSQIILQDLFIPSKWPSEPQFCGRLLCSWLKMVENGHYQSQVLGNSLYVSGTRILCKWICRILFNLKYFHYIPEFVVDFNLQTWHLPSITKLNKTKILNYMKL